MGKKIAKELGDNFKYYYGSYYGNYKGYDVIIKYDYASMLYNMYFSVKGKEKIDDLNKSLAKVDKYAVARYKKNNLTITEACDSSKDIPKLAHNILDVIIKYLEKNKYKNICKSCSKTKNTFLVDIDSNISFVCDECYKNTVKEYQKEIKEKKNIKEKIFSGILGAIIGCLPGLVLWIVLAYLMINPTVVALIIMLGSAYFYRHFAGSMKVPGLIISLIIGMIFVLFANEVSSAFTLYNEYVNQYNITIFDAYKAVPYYIKNNEIFRATYSQNFIFALMFGGFGGLTNLGIHRSYIAKNKIRKLVDKNEKTK